MKRLSRHKHRRFSTRGKKRTRRRSKRRIKGGFFVNKQKCIEEFANKGTKHWKDIHDVSLARRAKYSLCKMLFKNDYNQMKDSLKSRLDAASTKFQNAPQATKTIQKTYKDVNTNQKKTIALKSHLKPTTPWKNSNDDNYTTAFKTVQTKYFDQDSDEEMSKTDKDAYKHELNDLSTQFALQNQQLKSSIRAENKTKRVKW